MIYDNLDDYLIEAPTGDNERETKLDAERVTLEFAVAITPTKPQRSLESCPLFATGREEQGELWK
jgi:hypothetical protein